MQDAARAILSIGVSDPPRGTGTGRFNCDYGAPGFRLYADAR